MEDVGMNEFFPQGSVDSTTSASTMYGKLETMMSSIRKEAAGHELMKQKVKEMEGWRIKHDEIESKLISTLEKANQYENSLSEAQEMNTRIRSDMQRINDLYNTERRDHLEAKQQIITLESEVDKFRLEFGSLQSDALQAAELKHQNQHLVAQLNHGDRQMMDVKSAVEAMESRFKMKIEAQDEEFKRQNDQYLSTLQDRDNLRKEIERESLKNRTLEEKLTSLNLEKTKLGSIVEELLAKESADMHSSQMVADSLDKAKMKISELGQALGEKERKIISMSRQATDVENDHEKEKLGFAAKIAELSALVTQLQHEKNLIEKESQVNESKVGSIQVEMSRLSNEVQMAKDHSEAILKQKGEKELKLIEDRVGIAAQLDEVRALFMTAQSENEVLQGLLKDLKEKQYTEKQRQKELEALLVSETDALQHEIQDANESLRRVETEKAKLEEHIKGEAMSATKVSQTLRMELEKRVEELTTIRKERDLLQAERGKFLDEIAGLEARLQRDEATFKKTLENERNMTQGEVRTKINKLRSLEAEKADLLTELNSYMSQINDLKHSLAKAQQDVVEQRRIAGDCNSEADTATIKVMSLESQLLVSKRREEEVEEKCSKIDKEMKAQIMKHAQEMNEAIRPLNDQIKELEDQLRKAGDAADEQEVRYNRLKISEQKFAKEAEKARIDKEFSVNAYNEMEEKLSNEIGLLRVELRDQKLMNENGNQIQNRQEAMISELRLELSKSQNETKRERDDRITVEEKLEIAMRRLEQTQMDLDEANNTSKRHQTRLYEMEEDASKKEKALEKYRKDLEILEAESIAEVRRISLILSANEREIVDSRSVIANLQRELTESKSGMGMMKQSTNHTVHNLLDELRNTEDALSAARRKHHVEVEENHLKLSELQSNLDSVQSSLDVAESKLRADKTNNELRISQLETEVERLRKHSDGKDERIQELEKAKQTDRQRHLQMRDALTDVERQLVDARSQMGAEETQRKHLEARLLKYSTNSEQVSPSLSLSLQQQTFLSPSRQYFNQVQLAAQVAADYNLITPQKAASPLPEVHGSSNDEMGGKDEAEQRESALRMRFSKMVSENRGKMENGSATVSGEMNPSHLHPESNIPRSTAPPADRTVESAGAKGAGAPPMMSSSSPPLPQYATTLPQSLPITGQGTDSSLDNGMKVTGTIVSPREMSRLQQAQRLAGRASFAGAASPRKSQALEPILQERLSSTSGNPGTMEMQKRVVENAKGAQLHALPQKAVSTMQTEGPTDTIEESIERTQLALQRRLGSRVNKGKERLGTSDDPLHSGAGVKTAQFEDRKLHPPSVQRSSELGLGSGVEGAPSMGADIDITLGTPIPHAATPPGMNRTVGIGTNVSMSAEGATLNGATPTMESMDGIMEGGGDVDEGGGEEEAFLAGGAAGPLNSQTKKKKKQKANKKSSTDDTQGPSFLPKIST